jgi:glycosyltransferase involved in cell wall biosynthesis
VSEDEREQLYAGARLVVIPSLDEGFGFTALEAMSAGIPVLASDRGSLPEVVGDAGILIDPTDREALAGALERALTDDAGALELARKGLERARARDWRQAASRLHSAYTDAVRRRRDRA